MKFLCISFFLTLNLNETENLVENNLHFSVFNFDFKNQQHHQMLQFKYHIIKYITLLNKKK